MNLKKMYIGWVHLIIAVLWDSFWKYLINCLVIRKLADESNLKILSRNLKYILSNKKNGTEKYNKKSWSTLSCHYSMCSIVPSVRATESLFKQSFVLSWKCCLHFLFFRNTLRHVCFEKNVGKLRIRARWVVTTTNEVT